ncbi:dihydroorotate dehydrogenase [bacterium]|nr:dihydroorotate dehydrogenase [bacterium]
MSFYDDPRLRVKKGKLVLKNPAISASGTFGYGLELKDIADPNWYGGLTLKGITLKPRDGNAPARLIETSGGIINSIGLQNQGIDTFVEQKVLPLKRYDTAVIANINGTYKEDYFKLAERLDDSPVDYIEINVSCPNIKGGGAVFGKQPRSVAEIVKGVRKKTSKPLILKLTPQVTDIKEIAKAGYDSGIDIYSLINTYPAMAIDVNTRKPVLGNIHGGFSGPPLKPMAIHLVWELKSATNLPIIGMGGICSWEDAVEFLLAGADAVAVGTWHFVQPSIAEDINKGIIKYMDDNGFNSLDELSGYTWRKYNEN